MKRLLRLEKVCVLGPERDVNGIPYETYTMPGRGKPFVIVVKADTRREAHDLVREVAEAVRNPELAGCPVIGMTTDDTLAVYEVTEQ